MSEPTLAPLRPLRWWDVEPLLPLERELFGPEAWRVETWWAELAQPAQRRYVLLPGEEPDEVLGYAGVSVPGHDGDVMTVAVHPSLQGRGVGGLLVRRLVEDAAAMGAQRLLLEVRADNVPAQRLYAREGFERIAVRRGYYRTADGPADAWVMRRSVP
ncbi:ribosomal protein S18-alanine N-acetyltransferase [Angustibacter peucedani]